MRRRFASNEVRRIPLGYFFKLFFGLFVATAIALLALFIRPIDLDPRFGLGVGAIFAAVASPSPSPSPGRRGNKTSLPDTSGYGTTECACYFTLTLADVPHILAFVFIFLTLAESTLSLKLWCRGQETGHNGAGQETGHNANGGDESGRKSKRLDRWSFALLLALYIGLSAAAVAWY